MVMIYLLASLKTPFEQYPLSMDNLWRNFVTYRSFRLSTKVTGSIERTNLKVQIYFYPSNTDHAR